MRAGKLRHKITLQMPAGTRDAVGERTTTWAHVWSTRASIMPLKVAERFISSQMQSSVTHKIGLLYSSEISAIDNSWRVVFGSRIFTIDGVRDIEERHRNLELLCTEGLRIE